MTLSLSSPRLSIVAVLLGAAVSFAACDSSDTEVRDPDIFVADFFFQGADATTDAASCVNIDGTDFCSLFSFGEENARAYSGEDDDSQIQEGIRDMLNGADDGMAVIAYQAIPELDEDGNVIRATYYSMPYVQAVEGTAVVDDSTIAFVDYVTTLNYGYDDADFYLDIETSDLVSAEEIAENDLTKFIDIRLVTIPGEVIYQGSALRVDLAETYPTYSDLATAYDLPDRPMQRR